MQRRRGELRIIGGTWRSRRVRFADKVARPTPDRVRQTTFDWLAGVIRGARVLDLCAGSGAMGLEALSRGAGHCCFVERDRAAARAIAAAIAQLDAAARARVVQAEAGDWLARADADPGDWDIAFVDPPFDADLWRRLLPALAPRLAAGHRIYIEWPRPATPDFGVALDWLKQSRAGQVSFGLARVSAEAAPGSPTQRGSA